jgi:hypothetical protein
MTTVADSTPSGSLLWFLTTNNVVVCSSVNLGGLGRNLEDLNVNPVNHWASRFAQNTFVTNVTFDGIVEGD